MKVTKNLIQSQCSLIIVPPVIIVILLCQCTEAFNYCSLCQNHVACKYNAVNALSYGFSCSPDRIIVKMTNEQKEYILKLHNRMRNKLALGEIDGYSPAAKMPVFQWSNELEYLAELNVRSCEYGHDECHATDKYRWAGQNIARRGNTKGYEKTSVAIKNMITDWFMEFKDADMSYINSFRNPLNGKKIGHFTVMVNDKNNALGCALIRHQYGGFKYHYFACNYSFTNILQQRVYLPGQSASRCRQQHPVYKGLCSADQVVINAP